MSMAAAARGTSTSSTGDACAALRWRSYAPAACGHHRPALRMTLPPRNSSGASVRAAAAAAAAAPAPAPAAKASQRRRSEEPQALRF